MRGRVEYIGTRRNDIAEYASERHVLTVYSIWFGGVGGTSVIDGRFADIAEVKSVDFLLHLQIVPI